RAYSVFPRSAAHLVLHSFPTRRSSDLIDVFVGTALPRAVRVGKVDGNTGALGDLCVPGHLTTLVVGECAARQQGHSVQGGTKALDRKSTRLNSSHVKISYAVFCLKKKT